VELDAQKPTAASVASVFHAMLIPLHHPHYR
jgi:hypothetical protein